MIFQGRTRIVTAIIIITIITNIIIIGTNITIGEQKIVDS